MQFVTYIIKNTPYIPHLLLINNLWGRQFTELQIQCSLFNLEKCFSTGGSGSKQAALTGSQIKNELNRELMSSLIYLVVTSGQCFGPYSNPSSSDILLYSTVIVMTMFQDCGLLMERSAYIIQQHSLVPGMVLCTRWLVMTGAQPLTKHSE